MAVELELPPDPRSVRAARRWAADELAGRGLDEVVDTVVLLVSELVSNVVVHAGTPCTVRLDLDGAVRVEVRDADPRLPELGEVADPLAVSGRGLHLVRSLSGACGAELVPEGGKRVWFEVPLPAVVPAPAPSPSPAATA